MTTRPLVGIPASVRSLELNMLFHGTAEQYLRAVRESVGASVVTIPALEDADNGLELLERVDGILLTGSFSDIHPSAYGEPVRNPRSIFDSQRDALTLPLVRSALARAVPVFGICRGLQEINVALGGSLHQNVHDVRGRDDHRSDSALPLAEQFGPAHDIEIRPGGLLATLVAEKHFTVNTSHVQAVNRLASELRVDAVSADGTIEALSLKAGSAFMVGVQFHPEWGTAEHELYAALFSAFRRAVCKRMAGRLQEGHHAQSQPSRTGRQA